MKKKLKIATICAGLIFLLVVGIPFLKFVFSYNSYIKVFEKNWDISLPESGAKEVFAVSEPSFHGDGIRYHVIDYPIGNESKKMEEAKFQLEKIFLNAPFPTTEQIQKIESLLEDQDIPEDVIPDFGECYLVYQSQSDGSELYLLYWNGTGTLYIVESFI